MTQNPEMKPGENPEAALKRIRLWLELYPEDVSVAGQIGISDGFVSEGWPYRMYAVDRRDLEAVLDMAERNGEK
jgi:hypothetical protein